jgi:mono/diheme cytochrome c family protein
MRERDVRLCRANLGPEADNHNERFQTLRPLAGKVLLAGSVLLAVAGLPGLHARAASSADRDAGAELFKQNGCEHCHGVDGIGTDRGPSLSTVGKRLHKDQIEHQILDGGKQMPPFKDVLNDDETRKLVDYLAHKKKAPKPVPGG